MTLVKQREESGVDSRGVPASGGVPDTRGVPASGGVPASRGVPATRGVPASRGVPEFNHQTLESGDSYRHSASSLPLSASNPVPPASFPTGTAMPGQLTNGSVAHPASYTVNGNARAASIEPHHPDSYVDSNGRVRSLNAVPPQSYAANGPEIGRLECLLVQCTTYCD